MKAYTITTNGECVYETDDHVRACGTAREMATDLAVQFRAVEGAGPTDVDDHLCASGTVLSPEMLSLVQREVGRAIGVEGY